MSRENHRNGHTSSLEAVVAALKEREEIPMSFGVLDHQTGNNKRDRDNGSSDVLSEASSNLGISSSSSSSENTSSSKVINQQPNLQTSPNSLAIKEKESTSPLSSSPGSSNGEKEGPNKKRKSTQVKSNQVSYQKEISLAAVNKAKDKQMFLSGSGFKSKPDLKIMISISICNDDDIYNQLKSSKDNGKGFDLIDEIDQGMLDMIEKLTQGDKIRSREMAKPFIGIVIHSMNIHSDNIIFFTLPNEIDLGSLKKRGSIIALTIDGKLISSNGLYTYVGGVNAMSSTQRMLEAAAAKSQSAATVAAHCAIQTNIKFI